MVIHAQFLYLKTKEDIMEFNRQKEKLCYNCGTPKVFSSFYSHIIVGEKYIPLCKTCVNAKLKEYIKKTGDEGAGLWCLLSELSIPFIREVWNTTQKIVFENTGAGRKPDLLLTYLRTFKEYGLVPEGFWQSDVMLNEFIDLQDSEDSSQAMDVKKQIKIWGRFVTEEGEFDEEAYVFLNETFDSYTCELLEMDTTLINRYRDLCKAEWRLRKANESGDGAEISRASDSLTKQLTLLKLNNFQDNKQSETEKFIERMAWNIENTKPAECEDLNKYKDFSGFEPVWKDIMRTVKNLVAESREYPDIPKGEQ